MIFLLFSVLFESFWLWLPFWSHPKVLVDEEMKERTEQRPDDWRQREKEKEHVRRCSVRKKGIIRHPDYSWFLSSLSPRTHLDVEFIVCPTYIWEGGEKEEEKDNDWAMGSVVRALEHTLIWDENQITDFSLPLLLLSSLSIFSLSIPCTKHHVIWGTDGCNVQQSRFILHFFPPVSSASLYRPWQFCYALYTRRDSRFILIFYYKHRW